MIDDFNTAWKNQLETILEHGVAVAPRGMKTLELPSYQLVVDMKYPVLTISERKLNYRFMAAEAYWILSGSDDVAGVADYNPNIAQFSDDGRAFFGAYGPRIADQLPYVVEKLITDCDTRQATLTNMDTKPSEDQGCTVHHSLRF